MSENRIEPNQTELQNIPGHVPVRIPGSGRTGPSLVQCRAAAVIMECNPFHAGHRSILKSARALTGADYVIVLMSGDYVQRGEPAVLSKEERTRAVLENGADLVLELPVPYATGAADWFARGAISILSKLGVVTDLVFGSGSGNLEQLEAIAGILLEEPEEYKCCLKRVLAGGLSYPAARAAALREAAGLEMPEDSNDILGIEYLRALRSSCAAGSRLTRRPSSEHHTATANGTHPAIVPHAVRRVTEDNASSLRESMRQANPLLPSIDDYSSILLYRLWQADTLPGQTKKEDARISGGTKIEDHADVTPDLARRLQHNASRLVTCSSILALLKSKNYTYTRLSRALLHVILGITDQQMRTYEKAGLTGYARVLGFRRKAQPLLSAIAASSQIPLILREQDRQKLSSPFREMLQQDIAASELYDRIALQKSCQRTAWNSNTLVQSCGNPQGSTKTGTRQNSDARKTGAAPVTGTTPEYSKPLIIIDGL